MKYPVKVKMRPGLARTNGKLYAVGGCMVPVPEDTTMENLSDFMVFDPKAEAESEIKDRWTVEGSTGNNYTVTKVGGRLHCSCPGYGFRKKCKHTKKIADQLS